MAVASLVGAPAHGSDFAWTEISDIMPYHAYAATSSWISVENYSKYSLYLGKYWNSIVGSSSPMLGR